MKKMHILFLLFFLSLVFTGCNKKPDPNLDDNHNTKVKTYSLKLNESFLKLKNNSEFPDLEKIPESSKLIIEIILEENQILESLEKNGIKFTSYVHNNQFLFELTENTTISASYKEKEVNTNKFLVIPSNEIKTYIKYVDCLPFTSYAMFTNFAFYIENIPEGKKIKHITANSTKLEANSSGIYSFIIQADTNLNITLENKDKFKLALPENVLLKEPTGLDLNNIFEETEITLSLDLKGKSIDFFRVNGEDMKDKVKNNEFTFIIYKDTIIKLGTK